MRNRVPLADVADALTFAVMRHDTLRRKYTNEPYVTHLIAVAARVDRAGADLDTIKAALCHDVLEDTETTYDDLLAAIGPIAAGYVLLLTDSGKERGNRATRKAMDRERLRAAPAEVQTIKLADLIDNTHSIARHDPDFAKVYIAEKLLLLEVLDKGDTGLMNEARDTVRTASDMLATAVTA